MKLDPLISQEFARKNLCGKNIFSKKKYHNFELVFLPFFHLSFDFGPQNIELLSNGRSEISYLDKDLIKSMYKTLPETRKITTEGEVSIKKAREFLSRDIFSREFRGISKSEQCDLKFERIYFLAWPIWVQHHSTKEYYDFDFMDAITGEKNSLRKKTLLIDEFIRH